MECNSPCTTRQKSRLDPLGGTLRCPIGPVYSYLQYFLANSYSFQKAISMKFVSWQSAFTALHYIIRKSPVIFAVRLNTLWSKQRYLEWPSTLPWLHSPGTCEHQQTHTSVIHQSVNGAFFCSSWYFIRFILGKIKWQHCCKVLHKNPLITHHQSVQKWLPGLHKKVPANTLPQLGKPLPKTFSKESTIPNSTFQTGTFLTVLWYLQIRMRLWKLFQL